ncbi:unnamed protein product, partial [Prorocentrum cordatum]
MKAHCPWSPEGSRLELQRIASNSQARRPLLRRRARARRGPPPASGQEQLERREAALLLPFLLLLLLSPLLLLRLNAAPIRATQHVSARRRFIHIHRLGTDVL